MYEYLAIGERKVRGDGTVVEAVVEDALEEVTDPSETALHEAIHADVAEENGTSVVEASIVPSGNVLGFVRMSRVDAVAAAAPHADGHGGTGHDLNIVRNSGMSVASACAAARRKMSGRRDKIHRLAGHLEYRKRLSGQEVRRARRKIEDGDTVRVTITRPTGERKTTRRHGVQTPEILITSFDLPLEERSGIFPNASGTVFAAGSLM